MEGSQVSALELEVALFHAVAELAKDFVEVPFAARFEGQGGGIGESFAKLDLIDVEANANYGGVEVPGSEGVLHQNSPYFAIADVNVVGPLDFMALCQVFCNTVEDPKRNGLIECELLLWSDESWIKDNAYSKVFVGFAFPMPANLTPSKRLL